MGPWDWKRWKLERVGGLNINKEKMFTDSFCKHTLINKILQVLKNRTVQSHKNPCYWSSHQTWSQAMHGFTVIRICVSACPFEEYCQNKSKASKNSKKKKKKTDNDFALVFKNWLQYTETRKCGGNVWTWASNRPELKFSSGTILSLWA